MEVLYQSDALYYIPQTWKGHGDLLETDMMLKDFGGNASKTPKAVNVELMIGSKTLPTTFFVIDDKGTYSLHILLDELTSMKSF